MRLDETTPDINCCLTYSNPCSKFQLQGQNRTKIWKKARLAVFHQNFHHFSSNVNEMFHQEESSPHETTSDMNHCLACSNPCSQCQVQGQLKVKIGKKYENKPA